MTDSLRVTFVLDLDLNKKLRALLAEKIKTADRSVSFSSVLNEVLKEGLKKK
jgi:hypothetical protein